MISNDTTPPKRAIHDYTWQTLIEFTQSGEAGSEHLAADRVVEAMQILNWSDTSLERLKHTLTQAIRDTRERSRLYNSEVSLLIRVLISKDSKTTQEVDQVSDETSQGQVLEQTIQQINRALSHSWGFFLIQKQSDETPTLIGRSPHLIELFLYHERKPS